MFECTDEENWYIFREKKKYIIFISLYIYFIIKILKEFLQNNVRFKKELNEKN